MKYLSLNQNIISTHKIFVYFKIDEFGKITDIKTYGTENEFEEEAKRVVLALPRLNPVKIYGINKAYIYSLPITFKIED